jgi:hypothetical protein
VITRVAIYETLDDGQSLDDALEGRVDIDPAAVLTLVQERSVRPTPPSR